MRAKTVTGYIGIVDGKPYIDGANDGYEQLGMVVTIYLSLKAARARFEEVHRVTVQIGPRVGRNGRALGRKVEP
jgi:hypothetical protein